MTHDQDDMADRMAFDDAYRDGYDPATEVDWQRFESDAQYRRGVGQGRDDQAHGRPMDSQW